MSLYTPRHFTAAAPDDAIALMRAYPFATLITASANEPSVTHVPLVWTPGGGSGELHGHIAKANPHWQHFAGGSTMAVFHGPHAYISPSWYVQPEREVPTWNYATVHAHGQPELIDDRDAKLALIDRSVALFEAHNTPPWTRAVEGERLEAMLRSIVAFRMPIARLDAKFKMNQNRTAADRAQVSARLRDTGHPDLQAMAEWMRTHETG